MVPRNLPRPILLGHRGAKMYAPENTKAAFELALEHGCDGFEFDVRVTEDRIGILCHDPKLCGLEIAKSTADRLSHRLAEKGSAVDRLEVIVEDFAPRAFLNVELKVSGIEDAVIALLRKYVATERCIVSSFLPEVIRRLKGLGCEFPIGLICETSDQMNLAGMLPLQALMLERKLVTAELVENIHAAKQRVFVWTVNSKDEMLKLALMGVDGLISDDTALLARTLGAGRNSINVD